MDHRQNILLVRLKSMGDVLFTLPAVHAVRENFPEARLHFLVSRQNAPLLRGFSEIDEVIVLDQAVFLSKNFKAICRGAVDLLRRLRQPRFARVIDFQGFGETELLAWWTGAPERWGSVYRRHRGWLYSRGAWRNDGMHLADWNLSLLRQCGLPIGPIENKFVLPADALDEARKVFAACQLNWTEPTLFIQPFTSSPHKNWPLEDYLALAAHWRSRGIQILFGGGPSERPALEPARAAGFAVAAGSPLLVSAGLAKLSTLIVGGDTGLLHLAVAMGRRVVMLMGARAWRLTHPLHHPDWAVTTHASDYVSEIKADAVLSACGRALAEAGGRAHLSF